MTGKIKMRLTRSNEFAEQTGMTHVNNKPIFLDSKHFNECFDNLKEIINKLGQLEDIEDELGIDLITLFKALSCGAWERGKDNMLNFDDCKLLYKRIQIGSNVHWLSNYGKTWALTKEELEK